MHLLEWAILILPVYEADVQSRVGESKEKELAVSDKLVSNPAGSDGVQADGHSHE